MTRVFLVPLVLLLGCYSTSSSVIRRGQTFAFPPKGPIFATYYELETTKHTDILANPQRDDPSEVTYDDKVARTWPVLLDPRTGRWTRLAWVDGPMSPFYWAPQRDVLWVSDPFDQSVVGLTADGVTFPGTGTYQRIEPPFAFKKSGSDIALWNAITGTEVILQVASTPTIQVDGSIIRITELHPMNGGFQIRQQVVDWSNATTPRRLPDIQFTPPSSGEVLASKLTANGRTFVEIIASGDGVQMIAYELSNGRGATQAVPSMPATNIVLDAIGAGLVVVREAGSDQCWRGTLFDTASGASISLGPPQCVTGLVRGIGGLTRIPLFVRKGVGYFEPDRAELVDLGEVEGVVADGATSLLFYRRGAAGFEIQRHDLATATTTTLAKRVSPPSFLQVVDGALLIGEEGQLFAGDLGGGGAFRKLTVPEFDDGPDGVRRADGEGIGMRPRRSRIAVGGTVGVQTSGQLYVDGSVQLRRYFGGRWSLGVGAGGFESLPMHGETGTVSSEAAYGSGALYRYNEPGIRGFFVGSELRLGAGARTEFGMDRAWEPSVGGRVVIGHQGQWFEVTLDAKVPQFLALDRGVVFSIGLGLARIAR